MAAELDLQPVDGLDLQPDESVPPGLGTRQNLVSASMSELGMSDTARAAILGDIDQESSFDPHLSGDRGTSHGLLQVGTPLYRQFDRQMANEGIEPDDPRYT